MLEGLEIKEKRFYFAIENKDFRIDSQFYTKEPVKNPLLKYDKIGNLLIRAQYGISISMNEDKIGYPIYRMNEIHNMLCDNDVSKYAEISSNELKTFVLKDRDVVFNRTNSFEWVGRTGLYKKLDEREFVFASYLVRFIPNQNFLLPEFLTTFLNTKFGIVDVKRRARQSINQTNVNPEEVKEIEIPLLSITFQEILKNCFDKAHLCSISSRNTYNQAENLLLETLGLKDFEPSKEPVNIKNFAESFGVSCRLDAEYYQKKYDVLEGLVRLNSNFQKMSDIRTENFRGLQPIYVEDGDLDVINSKHILEKSLDYGNFEKTSSNYWDDQKRARVFKGDILTYTTGANIGRTQVYNIGKRAIASNHVNIVRLKNGYNPNYIGFVMNSQIGRLQTEKLSAGSAQAELYPKDIDNFLIPIIEKIKQVEIVNLLNKSDILKNQSEQLLDLAKSAVEKAVEENEEVAMKFIVQQLEQIEIQVT